MTQSGITLLVQLCVGPHIIANFYILREEQSSCHIKGVQHVYAEQMN